MPCAVAIKATIDSAWHAIRSPCDLPTGYIRESGQYEIAATADGITDLRLAVSDGELVPVELRADSTGVTARWSWSIEHYAGEVELCVRAGAELLHVIMVDVAPHPYKLGRSGEESPLRCRVSGFGCQARDGSWALWGGGC